MPNQDLLDFVSKQRAKGVNDEETKKILLENGWAESDVDAGLTNKQEEGKQDQKEEDLKELPSISDLSKESFEIYKTIFWKMIAIILSPMILLILATLALASVFVAINGFDFASYEYSSKAMWSFIPLGIIFFIFVLVVSYWTNLALLYSVSKHKEKLSFIDCFRNSWPMFMSFLWIGLLQGAVFLGSFALFIIPGILVYIYLVFSQYVMIEENKKGLAALNSSWAYVKGYWGAVAGRVYLLFILIMIISALLEKSEILSTIFSFVVSPFMVVYIYLLYKYLKRLNPAKEDAPMENKTTLIVLGIIGILAIVAIPFILAAVFVSFSYF